MRVLILQRGVWKVWKERLDSRSSQRLQVQVPPPLRGRILRPFVFLYAVRLSIFHRSIVPAQLMGSFLCSNAISLVFGAL